MDQEITLFSRSGRENMLQLDDLVYSYAEPDDPEIQAKITSKMEFNELAAPLQEKLPGNGGFFKTQMFVHRIMQTFDELLIISRAGTGKTGSAIGFAETTKNAEASIETRVDFITRYYNAHADHIRKVYVLVPGKILKSSFENQLVCQFSKKGEYLTKHVLEGKKEQTRKDRLNAEIKKYYIILTYSALAVT